MWYYLRDDLNTLTQPRSNAVVDDGTYTYGAFTYNTTNANLYVNGSSHDNNAYTPSGTFTTSTVQKWTGRSLTGNYFNGTIDEVRVSNVSRSSDWIAATSLSLFDTFITFGGEGVHNWAATFAVSGIPSTVFHKILTVNGTDYELGDLPVTFTGTGQEVVTYEYVNPVEQSLNLEYVISLVSGGMPAQTLRLNTYSPTANATVTATYGDVGNPVFPLLFIGLMAGILIAILAIYMKHSKKKG